MDSILFTSNILALHGLKYIYANDIKIPQVLSLVTFDELDASDLFYAPLTYLEQPISEMGKTATNILLENIRKEKKAEQISLNATLIVRQSTHPVISSN